MIKLDKSQFKAQLIEQLQTLPVCKPTSTRRNWVVRCPYCGDSKTINHGHFSILIDTMSDAPLLYRCFKCNDSGIITPQVLEDLGLYANQEFIRDLNLMNRTSTNGVYFKDRPKTFRVPKFTDCLENAKKLDYINRRLGLELTYEDCTQYKIVLSLVEFMRENHIRVGDALDGSSINLPMRSIQELDTHYVGFLSSNNNKITLRDYTPDQCGFFGRYYKVTIDPFNQSPNTFSGLVIQFDQLYTGDIDVHIAEGTFDIISALRNLPHRESENSLFFASCGYGFGTIIKYLVYMGVTTDINLHIYSDADKSDNDHRKALTKGLSKIWLDKVHVHRNGFSGEKDFGVPKDRIQEYTYELRM